MEGRLKAPWLKYYEPSLRALDYPDLTMYQMVKEVCMRFPEYPAYEFFGKKTGYRDMLAGIDLAARALRAMGIGRDDRVTICMPNCPQAIDLFYAVNKIGAVANMVHPLSAPAEIAFYIKDSMSSAVLIMDLFYDKLGCVRAQLDPALTVIVARMEDALAPLIRAGYALKKKKLPPVAGDHIAWRDFLARGRAYFGACEADTSKGDLDPAVILYSGGTTGTTKGILLSNRNFNALGLQTYAASGYNDLTDPGGRLKMLAVLPLFHGFGLGICIHMTLIKGYCCLLMPTFTATTYAKTLRRRKPNFIVGVPTLYEALLRNDKLRGADLSYLMGVFSGGDTLTVALKRRVDAFLKEHNSPVCVREGYGTTECVTACCLTPPDLYKEGSIGIPYPDTYFKIVVPGTCDEVACGEEGEICICGPTVMIGYNNNPKETAQTLRPHADGHVWLHTGDLGAMDEDGFVYFKQRIKRMIITSGYNVYPSQVENALETHPAVQLSCVVGVRDAYKMQRVKAFVVLKKGIEPSGALKDDILEYMKQRVAFYAVPKELEFRDELPKTLVGKVAYRELEKEESA